MVIRGLMICLLLQIKINLFNVPHNFETSISQWKFHPSYFLREKTRRETVYCIIQTEIMLDKMYILIFQHINLIQNLTVIIYEAK